MKKKVIVPLTLLALALSIYLTTRSNRPEDPVKITGMQTTEELLDKHPFQQFAGALKDELPEIRRYISNSFALVTTSTIPVTVILQVHTGDSDYELRNPAPEVSTCQGKIERYIRGEENITSALLEGHSSDIAITNFDSFVHAVEIDAQDAAKRLGISMSEMSTHSERVEKILAKSEYDAGTRIGVNPPSGLAVFGAERGSIISTTSTLQLAIQQNIGARDIANGEDPLFDILNDMRNKYALAKAYNLQRQRGGRSVIVVGYMHKNGYKKLKLQGLPIDLVDYH